MNLIVALCVTAFTASSALAAGQTAVLHFSNMKCGADPHIIEQSLAGLKGVESVKVSLEKQTATVSFDNAAVSIAQMEAAVGTAGFPPAFTQ